MRDVALLETCSASAAPALGWWRSYKTDFARYRTVRPGTSALTLLLIEQGLWALLQYRLASGIHRSSLPGFLKRPILLGAGIAQKLTEMTTGISLPYRAQIGPGLYIGHFGNIILHQDVVIGHTCNVSQGVTIGSSGRGPGKGTPVIGHRVYLATNAVVAGPIKVGDDAVVGANSLVTRDVPARVTVLGVPAKVVGHHGSSGYITQTPPDAAPDG